MAYSEEKDLIQNVKDLAASVEEMCQEFSQVQPSITEVLALRDEFTELADKTTGVIDQYESTLNEKNEEYGALLDDCRSQFKQVTNDVESLVNLQVNFESIKDNIEKCLALSNTVASLTEGPFVLMEGDDGYVEVADRLPYKHYLKVVDSIDLSTSSGGSSGGSGTISGNVGSGSNENVTYVMPDDVIVNPEVDAGGAYAGQKVALGMSYDAN
jgi:hypothetical protein